MVAIRVIIKVKYCVTKTVRKYVTCNYCTLADVYILYVLIRMSLSSSVVTHTDGKQAPVTYVEQVQGEETITILPNLAFQTGNPYPFGLDPVSVLKVPQYVYYIVEVHCHVESKYQNSRAYQWQVIIK